MSHLLRQIFQNATTRVLILVYALVIGITMFFLISGYYTQLHLYEEAELARLSGIAKTASLQIDGDAHQILYERYPRRDMIKSSDQNPVYQEFHQRLKDIHQRNKLETSIYTMVFESDENLFRFVVTSDSIPYFRHEWKEYHREHVDLYGIGGEVHPYTDENGTWLSAFYPLITKGGKVVGLIQADSKFDTFIAMAWKEILIRALISLSVIGLLGFILGRSIRGILLHEEELKQEILRSHEIIEAHNKDITDSIQYAKRIQEAILPPIENIRKLFPESFVLFYPRDIVSGDFYWFMEHDDRVFIAAVDCTGHGVPGAFMSMIGNTLLNEIVNQKNIEDPGAILDELDNGIKKALRQTEDNPDTRDGMDLSLVSICKHQKDLKFSGAFRPLYLLREGSIHEYKSNRFPIGGGSSYQKTGFTTYTVDLKENDCIYLFSDGFPDQIGGDSAKKFMTKRFKEILLRNYAESMEQQGKILASILKDWQGKHEQMDDILVLGLRIKA